MNFIRPAIHHILVMALAILFTGNLRSQSATPDDTARFLAGLPVSAGSPLAPLTTDPAWIAHAAYFNKAWLRLQVGHTAAARAWATTTLAAFIQPDAPVFYMFSGPDVLYADVLFPSARTIVLSGLEPTGDVPDLTRLQPADIPNVLNNIQVTLSSVLQFSFFITKDMRRDFAGAALKGNLPAIYVLLSRMGHRLLRVDPVSLDRGGSLVANGSIRGVRIVYESADGSHTVYYFTTDLSNDGIKSNPGFVKYCASLGTGNTLLKSASYLPHEAGFSHISDFMLEHSGAILQDDSGIPLRLFDPAKWTIRLFGTYVGPIDLFKQYPQPDLAQLYQRTRVLPLSFGYGYQHLASKSNLLLAVRGSSTAAPGAPERIMRALPVNP